ncbi:MAG: hypothetical protein KDB87_00255 [Flavobacteriales bacterium]|nr:hypothetical protein [Flavobacteriales bacterium]MCB0811604.1 hypothetical protein [Flavobacteriales bacterium]MCB0818581.1 hypothetical protein [Flavobacteriales bacterium]HPJ54301.1 hypothetical protein [Flavobacteriales bacterium]
MKPLTKLTTVASFILWSHLPAQLVDIPGLRDALVELEIRATKTNQTRFFELFPNSFESFEATFGYSGEQYGPLYDGHEYVVKFFSLDSVPELDQFTKWVDISIGGKWSADAVNYFLHDLRPRILSNAELTYEVLSERRSEDVESFFYFFFHEIHPQFEEIPEEFDLIKDRDQRIYGCLVRGHERALRDSGH